MSVYTDNVNRMLKGLDYVSPGPCLGCHECGLDGKRCDCCKGYGTDDDGKDCQKCNGEGTVPCDESDVEKHSHDEFSVSQCDCCGSRLAGSRYPAHGIIQDGPQKGEALHLDICEDCVFFLAYGDEPDNSHV